MKFKGNNLCLTEDTFIELKVVKTNMTEGYFDELVSVETLLKYTKLYYKISLKMF